MLALAPDNYIITKRPGNGANGAVGCPLRARLHSLSPRQKEAVEMAAAGMMDKVIASAMGITESTAKQHVQIAMQSLGVSRRIMLAPLAVADKKMAFDRSRLRQSYLDIAEMIADGLTDEDIAHRAGIPVTSVKVAVRAIRAACGGGTRTAIAIAVLQHRKISGGQ